MLRIKQTFRKVITVAKVRIYFKACCILRGIFRWLFRGLRHLAVREHAGSGQVIQVQGTPKLLLDRIILEYLKRINRALQKNIVSSVMDIK